MLDLRINTTDFHASAAQAVRDLASGCRDAVEEAGKTSKATARVLAPHRSYELRNKIDARVTSAAASGATGIFEGLADHTSFMEDGTIPHAIVPKAKKFLRFEGRGGIVFTKRVSHPGTDALGFMRRAAESGQLTIERVANRVADAVAARMSR